MRKSLPDSRLRFVLALALQSTASATLQSAPGAPPEPQAPAEAEIEYLASPTVEHYVLELPGVPGARADRVGYLSLDRRLQVGSGTLEATYRFSEDGLTIRHVETYARDGARQLVWRESGPQALRSWLAAQAPDCPWIEIQNFGIGEPHGTTLTPDAELLFPLRCWELLRGQAALHHLRRLSPLTGSAEELLVVKLELDLAELPGPWREFLLSGEAREPRAYRLRRLDGSSGEALLLDGDVLVGLELQPGGLCARRIDAATLPTATFQADAPQISAQRFELLRNWAELPRLSR